jgi:tetratricopeptide (TPR) repeat protein
MSSAALVNLGELEGQAGRWREAERYFQRALELDEASLGPEHPDLGMDLSMLASAYVELGRAHEAVPLLERALVLMRGEPLGRAETEFDLARALWVVGRERPRALRLARDARAFLAGNPEAHADKLAEVDAWLKARSGR